MHRIDGLDTVATPPAPRPLGTPGFFGPGNAASGQLSTQVTFEWANSVQEEIVSVIEEAGLTLDKADNTQLLQAVRSLGVGLWQATVLYGPGGRRPWRGQYGLW